MRESDGEEERTWIRMKKREEGNDEESDEDEDKEEEDEDLEVMDVVVRGTGEDKEE